MPTTRRQAALQNNKRQLSEPAEQQPQKRAKRNKPKSSPEAKPEAKEVKIAQVPASDTPWMPGTIERGHVYFFFRPRVQVEEATSVDDVRNLQMILVPRPPEFATCLKNGSPTANESGKEDGDEMNVMNPGEDAVPSDEPLNQVKKRYRIILIGKKQLPNPSFGGKGYGRKQTFWATVTKVGDDLDALDKGLGEKTYETKTRGTRHEDPVRFVARGGYAIVNNDARTPSKRETHFGYYLSHPNELGQVQKDLGIEKASSFVLQLKNPLAPATGPMEGRGGKGAEYPSYLMQSVFGKGGRESYGLRFAPCVKPELLDYEGAQLLLIAARGGEEGLEASLGEGRGDMLSEKEKKEGLEPVANIFKELALDAETFPAAAIEGEWV